MPIVQTYLFFIGYHWNRQKRREIVGSALCETRAADNGRERRTLEAVFVELKDRAADDTAELNGALVFDAELIRAYPSR